MNVATMLSVESTNNNNNNNNNTTFGSPFHPHFSSPDGDVVLCSHEGTLFRVHSYTLRATSGLFKTIFDLPQPPASKPTRPDNNKNDPQCTTTATTIPIYESSFLLAQLLPLVTGKHPMQPLQSLDLSMLARLLFLAEKWDASGPISHIRNVINSSHSGKGSHIYIPYSPFSSFPPLIEPTPFPSLTLFEKPSGPGPLNGFFRTDPMRVYVLARHFGWREEAERAAVSMLTFTPDDLDKKWNEVREGRSYYDFDGWGGGGGGGGGPEAGGEADPTMFMVTNRDWELLVDLRKRRCNAFRDLIDSRERFTAGNNPNYSCIRCGFVKLDNSSWDVLKRVMIAEFDRRPLGDTLLAAMAIPAGLNAVTDPGNTTTTTATATATTTTTTTTATTPSISSSMTMICRNDGEPWPELVSCFKAKCPNIGCGAANYDPLATLKQIRRCVEELPWRITWDDDRK